VSPTDTCIMTSASLVFPTPVLMSIVGRPTNSSLQVMQQQLYQNTRAIASPLGGGENGHLGLIMPPAEYILRPGAIEFDIPVHPGILEAAGVGATEKHIADLKRVYLNELMLLPRIKQFDLRFKIKLQLPLNPRTYKSSMMLILDFQMSYPMRCSGI
jgi:hypothetical protein